MKDGFPAIRPHFFAAGETYRRTVPPVTDALIAEFETRRGLKLPRELEQLLRIQNGGELRYQLFMADDQEHRFQELPGMGPTRYGFRDLLSPGYVYDEQGANISGSVVVLEADHNSYSCLDYRQCGPRGEPSVVYILDLCNMITVTPVASSFAQLVDGLQRDTEKYFVGLEGVENPIQFARRIAERLNAKLDYDDRKSLWWRLDDALRMLLRRPRDQWQPPFRIRHSSWQMLEGVDLVPNIDYARYHDGKNLFQRPAGLEFPEYPECDWLLECRLFPRHFAQFFQQIEQHCEVPCRLIHRSWADDAKDDLSDEEPQPDIDTSQFVAPDRELDFDGIHVEWPGAFGNQGTVMGTRDSNPANNDYCIFGNYHGLRICRGKLSLTTGTSEKQLGKVREGDRIQVLVDGTVLVNGIAR